MTGPELASAGTAGQAWFAMRAAFREAGLETADLDARLLCATLLEMDPHQLMTNADRPVSEVQRQRLMQVAAQRLNGMPVHRILGAREFYGLVFGLSPGTLEPRPDTETLIDAVLPFVRATAAAKGACSIADLGIGTGAIGLALLDACREARCLGVDVSADAVATATDNARVLGLSERYAARTGDWLSGIDARFDLIVSNPPYIPTADLATLARDVIEHDPMLALDGGADGLSAYRQIASQAPSRLEHGGLLALEIGIGQTASVTALFAACGFQLDRVVTDLGGVERVLLFTIRSVS